MINISINSLFFCRVNGMKFFALQIIRDIKMFGNSIDHHMTPHLSVINIFLSLNNPNNCLIIIVFLY